MRARLPLLARLFLAASASAGALMGHGLGYHLAEGHADRRADLLAVTGHGPSGRPTAIVLGIAVLALSNLVAKRSIPEARPSYRSILLHLGTLQVAGFLVLEAVERLNATGSLFGIVGEPAVVLGVLAQVVVALVGALVILLFVRLFELIRGGRPREVATAGRRALVPHSYLRPSASVGSLAWNLRGPPSVLPS